MSALDADRVIAALRGAFARDAGRVELLRTAAEKIRAHGAPYTSVYLYMLHGDTVEIVVRRGATMTTLRATLGTRGS